MSSLGSDSGEVVKESSLPLHTKSVEDFVETVIKMEAQLEDDTCKSLMERNGLEFSADITKLREKGFRLIRETMRGTNEHFYYLCKVVDSERVPKLVFPSNPAPLPIK